jgi:hypothetical protein
MKKIKAFINSEISCLKSDITKLEYVCWWVLRILMVWAIITKYRELGPEYSPTVLNLVLNLFSSFAVTLIRLLLVPKRVICKLPYRVQTYIDILVFFASFCGHGLNTIAKVPEWDKLMHLLTGALFVFIGNEIIKMFMREDDRISPAVRTFTAFGFSNVAIVFWEMFEFFTDYYWPGSTNQGYNCQLDPNSLFVKIFGMGAQNEYQWAVVDTCVDMTYAFITSVVASIILVKILSIKEKKTAVLKQTVTV